MSYTPTNWKAGDVVTSAKLNKMEQGIAASGGIRIVHLTMGNDHSMQLDITPNELIDAFDNEEIVVITGYEQTGGMQSLISTFYQDDTTFTIIINQSFPNLTSSDPDEYYTYVPNSGSSDDSGNSDTGR